MLQVSPRLSCPRVAFKGTDKAKETSAEVKSSVDTSKKEGIAGSTPKTHAGLKTGAVTAGVYAVLDTCLNWSNLKNRSVMEWLKGFSKLGIAVGCGVLVDTLINNKFKKGEENNATGKKWGPVLGALCGVGSVVSSAAGCKALLSKAGLLVSGITTAILAAGGLMLGAITDHFANKTAKKAAEAANPAAAETSKTA